MSFECIKSVLIDPPMEVSSTIMSIFSKTCVVLDKYAMLRNLGFLE